MSVLIGNIFAFVAVCFTFLSAWSRDRKRIYLYQAAQCGILAIANIFFASLSGVTTYALCTARNLLLAYERFTPRLCYGFVAAVAGLIALAVAGILTFVIYQHWEALKGA